ncbi:MAG TPA: DUF5663 domain-containing protein [Candidatus Saccharimonas sp.]|nr:DUF5663 domain-containing protein [Candidatus Saccharimonas sp.]
MALLDRTFLTDLGIALSDEDYQALSAHFETTLHERVIDEIVDELTPEQAEELAHLQQSDDATLQQWLTTNVSDLDEIVSDEVDILLGEIAENSEAIQGSNE